MPVEGDLLHEFIIFELKALPLRLDGKIGAQIGWLLGKRKKCAACDRSRQDVAACRFVYYAVIGQLPGFFTRWTDSGVGSMDGRHGPNWSRYSAHVTDWSENGADRESHPMWAPSGHRINA